MLQFNANMPSKNILSIPIVFPQPPKCELQKVKVVQPPPISELTSPLHMLTFWHSELKKQKFKLNYHSSFSFIEGLIVLKRFQYEETFLEYYSLICTLIYTWFTYNFT
jgi:hypothetical protein